MFPVRDISRDIHENHLWISYVWPGYTYDMLWELPYMAYCQLSLNVKQFLAYRQGTAGGGK